MNIYYDVEDNHYRTYPNGDIATVDQMKELIENKDLSIVKLQQENQQLQERIEYLERSNNRREDTILEQRQEISNLEDNWNELKKFLKNTRKENLEWDKKHNCEWKGYNAYSELLIKMQELEQSGE